MLKLFRSLKWLKSSFHEKLVKETKQTQKGVVNNFPKIINPKINSLSQVSSLIGKMDIKTYKSTSPTQSKKWPVVTVMGHVDHGKTTLIDYLRKSNIAEKQQGGITQKIGAFSISIGQNKVTFIDTPGHQAFVNMRHRGAKVTDLVILMISAVEGVQKQTIEVIELLKKQNVKAIVAINKIDVTGANPEDVQEQLNKAGLRIQPYGGQIPVIHISAKNGTNLNLLCELIIQQTKDCEAQCGTMCEATVLEACQNSSGLNTCTLIIQRGILKIGSIVIIKDQVVKVKIMQDDRGNNVIRAVPGQAVQIVGISHLPKAGDFIFEVQNQNKAKFIVQKKLQKQFEENQEKLQGNIIQSTKIKVKKGREKRQFYRGGQELWADKYNQTQQKILAKMSQLNSLQTKTPETLLALEKLERQLNNHKEFVSEYFINVNNSKDAFNVIFKFADRGIEQTILLQINQMKASLEQNSQVKIRILKSDVGQINENDIKDASLFNAEILGFGVGVKAEATSHLSSLKIVPKTYKLIHLFLKDFKNLVMNKKKNSIEGIERGRAIVIETYKLKTGKNGSMTAFGASVQVGKLSKKHKFYLIKNGIPYSLPLTVSSIKSFKKQMLEVKKGQQFTIIFKDENLQIEKGDEIVTFE